MQIEVEAMELAQGANLVVVKLGPQGRLARGNAVGALIATGRGSAADLLSQEAITSLLAH